MKAGAVWLKYEKVLLRCFLFSGFDAPRLSRVLSGRGEVLSFDAGQAIFSPHCFKRAVGVFLQGKAQAEKFAEGRTVVLNRFEPPMMFGAAAVFRQAQEYVTQVTAKTRCRVLFLTDEELDAIFQEDFAVARNYISFLSVFQIKKSDHTFFNHIMIAQYFFNDSSFYHTKQWFLQCV